MPGAYFLNRVKHAHGTSCIFWTSHALENFMNWQPGASKNIWKYTLTKYSMNFVT